jgi:SAM-dependent methyltransferase
MTDIREQVRDWWDADASVYDASVGHAMTDPVESAAWAAALEALLPEAPARILDVGAGTGSLSLAAAALGHEVTGIDLSDGMLAGARKKAEVRGLAVRFEHRPAEEPPPGPFDAVIERHVAWTLPEPVGAFEAWRSVTEPGGRLILFEGSWGGEGRLVGVRDVVAERIERLYGVPDDHHDVYPEEVVARMPLARTTSPRPFLEAVAAAGWSKIHLIRLRDIEWAIARRQPWPLGWLTRRPRYAIVASSG